MGVGKFAEWYPVSNETECREGGDAASQNEASKPKPDFCREAVSRGDLCCENAVGNFFLCGGQGGSCCGNACAGVGSKCCKGGTFDEWNPVSNETECREGRVGAPPTPASLSQNQSPATMTMTRKPKPDFCGEAASRGDLCCENAVGDFFLCGGRGGSCCGNACAAVGSKCCKVGTFAEWYPVSNETECREGRIGAPPTPASLSQNQPPATMTMTRKPKPDFCREAVSRGDL